MGWRKRISIACLAILSPCQNTMASLGVWARTDKTPYTMARFSPDFSILKLGAFANSGVFKPVLNNEQIRQECARRKRIDGWIGHRLKPNEVLSPGAGQRLGEQLNTLLTKTCVEAVELDIEPLPTVPPWLAKFLGRVRRGMDTQFRLHLAVPMITVRAIPGPHWTAREAVALMPPLDGIDVMAYDTGATSADEYQEWLYQAVHSLGAYFDRLSQKVITIGLPAYHDRTALHSSNSESLLSALTALTRLDPALVCRTGVRFAFYAEWTMRPEDRTMAARLVRWKKNGCR